MLFIYTHKENYKENIHKKIYLFSESALFEIYELQN